MVVVEVVVVVVVVVVVPLLLKKGRLAERVLFKGCFGLGEGKEKGKGKEG